MQLPSGLEPAEDLSAAQWVIAALKDWPSGRRFVVRDLVPPVFEAYGRVRHADRERRGTLSRDEVGALTRALLGRTPTDEMCWFAVWPSQLEPGATLLLAGGSPRQRWATFRFRRGEERERRRARRAIQALPTFELLGRSGRSYVLMRGAASDVLPGLPQRGWFDWPPLWWPDDRSWLVHTETDATATLVGGSRAIVDALLSAPGLDAVEVQAADPADL
jgi:hypothetical protein